MSLKEIASYYYWSLYLLNIFQYPFRNSFTTTTVWNCSNFHIHQGFLGNTLIIFGIVKITVLHLKYDYLNDWNTSMLKYWSIIKFLSVFEILPQSWTEWKLLTGDSVNCNCNSIAMQFPTVQCCHLS